MIAARVSVSEGSTCYIPTDRQPYIPRGWELASHRSLGILEWGAYRVEFLQHELQLMSAVRGDTILRRFAFRRFLNATVLDYLLSYPTLIPEEWKYDRDGRARVITFFGTTYDQPRDHPWVRYMSWDEENRAWEGDIVALSDRWHGRRMYAAALKQHAFEGEGAVG